MIFFEFLCRKLLGPPPSSVGGGTWPCPNCGRKKFHVRPSKPGKKDRASCWVCDYFADEFDLLKWKYPLENFGQRKERLAQLGAEYHQAGGQDSSFSSSAGETGNHGHDGLYLSPEARKVLDWLINGLPPHLADYLAIREIADKGDRNQAALLYAVPELRAAAKKIAKKWRMDEALLLEVAAENGNP